MITILEAIVEKNHIEECKKQNHEWVFDDDLVHSIAYNCKHCPARLLEPNDCGTGA